MPMLLKHIDKIAREKQRGVLFVSFDIDPFSDETYEDFAPRKELMAWMEAHDIPFEPCANLASDTITMGYMGELYIDIPMDENDPRYQLLTHHLEHEDGTIKIDGIEYFYLPLEVAMKNAHHDEPGYWERIMEDF